MSNSYCRIGFHTGSGGNRTGIGEYFRRLAAADRPAILKAAADHGVVSECLAANPNNITIFRLTGGNLELPDYSLAPGVAAREHWARIKSALPSAFDKRTWLEVLNEPDKNKADWLGKFAVVCGELMVTEGYRFAAFGWSAGEPERFHWETDGMLDFLRFAEQHKNSVSVALHEYSLNANDITALFPYLLGRYRTLHDVCDAKGIARPKLIISEVGWEYSKVPEPDRAMQDIEWMDNLYQEPNILGCALWYLGSGFGGIADQAQRFIAPLTEYAVNKQYEDVPDPPSDDDEYFGYPREQYKRTYWYVPATLPLAERKAIYIQAAESNITVGPSADDAGIGALHDKIAVLHGLVYSEHQIYRDWFDLHYPGTKVEIVSDFFKLAWPTEEKRVTQIYGDNPAIYNQFGLPGHEGIDLAASMYSDIVACHDGEVYMVYDNVVYHNYGIHVRIKHKFPDGHEYKTVYAHLNHRYVKVGGRVIRGQVIGQADNTGNSTGSHLHLTLKKTGATASGETNYPFDIIDPTPYLDMTDVVMPQEPAPTPGPFPPGDCLVGLHGRADGRMLESDYEAVRVARIEAVKLLSSAAPENVDRLVQINPNMFIVVRLFVDLSNRVMTPEEFCRDAINDVGMYYDKGVRHFEVHNEPNLSQEGLGKSWHNGHEFAVWFDTAVGIMKAQYPDALFGWPGLSPGGDVAGVRYDALRFLTEAGASVRNADWIGIHSYFVSYSDMASETGGFFWKNYQRMYPGKLCYITEFSNPTHATKTEKAHQYVDYYNMMRNQDGIGAAFCFVSSASTGFDDETWVWVNGTLSAIPGIVGNR